MVSLLFKSVDWSLEVSQARNLGAEGWEVLPYKSYSLRRQSA